jgi:subtilisin family serine protease
MPDNYIHSEEVFLMESALIDQPKSQSSGGCSGVAAIVFLSLFIVAMTVIVQITDFFLMQTIFEGSLKVPNIRWMITLGFGLLLFVPLLIAGMVVKEPVARAGLNALRNISILVMLLAPSHFPFVTNWQLTAELQIAALVVFLAGVLIFRKKSEPGNISHDISSYSPVFLALAAGAVLGIPWVLWGALGSSFDILMGILVSAGLGASLAVVAAPAVYVQSVTPEDEQSRKGIGMSGWIITLAILMLTTAVDQNGNGWLLLVSMLPLGFACSALVFGWDGEPSFQGKMAAGCLAALGFLWPMLMVDPDELSLVISSGDGELFGYAAKAAGVGLFIALVVMTILIILRRSSKDHPLPAPIHLGMFVFTWAGIIALFLTLGKPGFYGEKVFVIMKSQAALSSEKSIPDAMERRKAVYVGLVKNAEDSQKDIRAWLDGQHVTYRPYYLVNALELDAGPVLRKQIEARSDVDRVLDSPILRPLKNPVPVARGELTQLDETPWGIQSIEADKVHDELGVAGEGVVIGQSDSGVQGDHPEIAAQYRGKFDGTDDYNWFDPWYGSTKPVDIGGHGTHTMGTMVGERTGVAPKAEWIGCVNLARNLGNPGYYLDCMQFMLAPFPQNGDPFKDGKPEKGANVLNNSWGCPTVEGCDAGTYLPAVSALKTAGVFVVASAGNTGYGGCSTVQDPLAIYGDVYTVGAINAQGNLAGFSSLGPVDVDGSHRIKPDIVAPGEDVISSYPNSTYYSAGGTSMAGPHVVGVVALMWSANPKLIGDIDKTREILNETADTYTGEVPECVKNTGIPNNASGYGNVNAYKAVQKSLEIR